MIIFNTFWKCLKACKGPIILYTVLLILFGGFNFATNETSSDFSATKPDILIVNNDEYVGLTKDLIDYLNISSNVKNIDLSEESIKDALFYRDVNFVIYIPKNFRIDFLNNKNPEIKVESNGNYESSLAQMYLNRYLKIASTYLSDNVDENKLISLIDNTLKNELKVEMSSTLDTSNLSKASFYYNFASYSLLAGCVYTICLILSSFKNKNIKKRTVVSSFSYKKMNSQLLLSCSVFALIFWIFYILLSFILIGNSIFNIYGVLFMFNSFIFTLSCLCLAFLIGNIMSNKNAINGVINVIALGSAFLCGAFVPAQFLPPNVLNIAHAFPAYYYINSNELIKSLEVININTLKPFIFNIAIMLLFSLLFIIITNIITKIKRES